MRADAANPLAFYFLFYSLRVRFATTATKPAEKFSSCRQAARGVAYRQVGLKPEVVMEFASSLAQTR